MSDNQNNDSYVFVDASTKNADNSYAQNPAYPYVFPAWEWLLERTLRRRLLLTHFTDDAALAILALRSKSYRMHRWPPYGGTDVQPCTKFPDSMFQGSLYTGAVCHDGLLANTRPDLIVTGYNRAQGKFTVEKAHDDYYAANDRRLCYGVFTLAEDVDLLLDRAEFLAPDWTPPSNFRIESSMEETTTGQMDENGRWTWDTSVTHAPYRLPAAPFFRLLRDVRADEPAVEASVEDSEGNLRRVRLAKTFPARRNPDDLFTYKGVKVLDAGYHGVNTDKSLAFETRTDLAGTSGTLRGSGPYRADSPESRTDAADAVHAIPGPIERTRGSAVYADAPRSGSAVGYVQPDVDWNGEPTWWHANGFPKGLDSVSSGRLKRQLQALSVTQPAIPPVVLYSENFPEDGFDCFEDGWARASGRWFHLGGSHAGPVALAATPHCISKMLDAMTKTVFAVPALFFEVDATEESKTTDTTFSGNDDGDGEGPSSGKMDDLPKTYEKTVEEERTYKGTAISDAPLDLYGDYESDDISGTYTSEVYQVNRSSSTVYGETLKHWSRSDTLWVEGHAKRKAVKLKSPVILRANASTVASVKGTSATKTYGTGYDAPVETSTEWGRLPDSADPADTDLMFPAWLRKWIAKAELFMSYEAVLYEGYPDTETSTRTTTTQSGTAVIAYSGSGTGSRVTKSAKGVVSLGEMDLSTGRFPDIDLVRLRGGLVPAGGGNRDTSYRVRRNTTTSVVGTSVRNSDTGESLDVVTTTSNDETLPGATYYRSSKLFVTVEWKFDDGSPEPFGERPGEYDATLSAMRARDAAKVELDAARNARLSAESDVVAKSRALDGAQEALDRAMAEDPPPERERIDELTGRVEDAQAALADSEAALERAEEAAAAREQALAEAEQTLLDRTEEYRSALEGYQGPRR